MARALRCNTLTARCFPARFVSPAVPWCGPEWSALLETLWRWRRTPPLSAVVLIAIPIMIPVYFNSGLTYGLMKLLRVPHNVAGPGALIRASKFFELAVATPIALYGPGSGAALATVVVASDDGSAIARFRAVRDELARRLRELFRPK